MIFPVYNGAIFTKLFLGLILAVSSIGILLYKFRPEFQQYLQVSLLDFWNSTSEQSWKIESDAEVPNFANFFDEKNLKKESNFVKIRLTNLIEKRIFVAKFHVNEIRKGDNMRKMASSRLVTHLFNNGRLGNWMFQAASLIGIARSNDRIPVLVKSQKLRTQLFSGFRFPLLEAQTLFPSSDALNLDRFEIKTEMAAAKYNPDTQNLTSLCNCQDKIIVISGYLQSWKYFQDNFQEIRQTFTLRKGILNAAKSQILDVLDRMNNGKLPKVTSIEFKATSVGPTPTVASVDPPSTVTLVGIHVRRGDHLNADISSIGHIPATDGYLLRTTQYMTEKYPNVVFFVVTDDVAYCRNIFRGENFAVLEGNRPEVDMGILTLMDRLILTVGTFGWWGAFLSDAEEVLHFRDWPKNGSTFDKMLNKADFFPPSWVAWS